ncbi:MAG: YeeE/YedE family protein [Phaeodactylibacter sp.]|nr:YeeE/YedE family protein [Phaeodactylibacter sp.]MCB9301372.1 YeeE/YedE family protein [Lewinellaceae bacterium]
MELIGNSNSFVDFVSQPWHWAVSGAAIALVLALLTWMGRSFGVSMTFKDMCSIAGAGKKTPFFRMDLKDEYWRIAFVVGGLVGGIISVLFLKSPEPVAISHSTIDYLATIGINYPEADAKGMGFVPTSLFNFSSIKGILLALGGGFLIGFGARYGDGCTSGHAISGLAHLQLPSLITVIGFFIGGLLMTNLLFPWLLSL